MNTDFFEPYYAVIFTSYLTGEDVDGYGQMAKELESLAARQEGYIGFESARENIGISISYWRDLESISKWKNLLVHLQAQEKGKSTWYQSYKVRIAKIEREYEMS